MDDGLRPFLIGVCAFGYLAVVVIAVLEWRHRQMIVRPRA
jgi:hypothetical protein